MVNIKILKLQIYIPHEKYSTHIFSCLSHAPFRSYVPLKTKSSVQEISKGIKARAIIFSTLIGAEE